MDSCELLWHIYIASVKYNPLKQTMVCKKLCNQMEVKLDQNTNILFYRYLIWLKLINLCTTHRPLSVYWMDLPVIYLLFLWAALKRLLGADRWHDGRIWVSVWTAANILKGFQETNCKVISPGHLLAHTEYKQRHILTQKGSKSA